MPPPSGNENQGLKIAVASFVMLSVILAVATYFGFKNYSETDAKLTQANSDLSSEKREQARLTGILNDFKDKVGLSKTEFDDLVKAATKSREDLLKKAVTIRDDVVKVLDGYKETGADNAKLTEARQSLDAIISGLNDPNGTILSTAERYAEMTSNQALIAALIAAEFETTRKNLEDTNKVNQSKLDVETAAAKKSNDDILAEIDKHERDRVTLGEKVGVLQEDTNKQAQEIARLKNEVAQKDEDYRKQREDLLTQLKYFRDITERKETVLDKADGTLTFVDYGRGEVRTDLTRGQGAREQMVFSIFDRSAPGLPSDKPKGTIELIQVGTSGSVGRIIKTNDSITPMRTGDQVYSPAWDSNRPLEYALIGKIDMNRDGRDDRDDLRRMIEKSGGKVAYDLPPSNVGTEKGELTRLIAWYVIDDRDSFYPSTMRQGTTISTAEQTFLNKRTEAIKTARSEGIRPKRIESLLAELGYSYGASIPGRTEAANRPAIEQLKNPRGRVGTIPADEPEAPEEQPQ